MTRFSLAVSCLAFSWLASPAIAAEPPAKPLAPCWAELFREHGPQWAAPTEHAPLDLKHVLSGAGCVIIARPAELWDHPEGEKLRTAEPLASLIRMVNWFTGRDARVSLPEIEQLIVAIPNDPGMGYQASLVVRLKTPVETTKLRQALGRVEEWEHEGRKFLTDAERLYFLPPGNTVKLYAVAAGVSDRKAIAAELAGARPALWRREMESLLAGADGNRHLTVVFSPIYLLGQGKHLLSGPLAPVLSELRSLTAVDDRSRELAKGVLVSLHAGEYFHCECRVEGGNAQPPALLAHALYERLAAIPARVHAQFEANADALGQTSGRAVLARYPLMLSALAGYLRAGVEGRQAVLTSVLPPEATHNLALGTAWALVEPTACGGPRRPAELLTMAERLAKPIGAFKIPSDSIDRIVDILRDELGVEIELLGRDLEEFGITKGRRMSIDLKNATAAEALTELARQGNPAVLKDVASADQHLVWVVDASRGPGKERILFTTRARASTRGALAPAFAIMTGEK